LREILWYNGRQTVLKHFHDSEYLLRPAATRRLRKTTSFLHLGARGRFTLLLHFRTGARGR